MSIIKCVRGPCSISLTDSLAKLIGEQDPAGLSSTDTFHFAVYSMAPDGKQLPKSGTATPFEIPVTGGGDYFSVPAQAKADRKYLAGCKALDSLARMIVSLESFFHPSNSGSWTTDVSNAKRHYPNANVLLYTSSSVHSSNTSCSSLANAGMTSPS